MLPNEYQPTLSLTLACHSLCLDHPHVFANAVAQFQCFRNRVDVLVCPRCNLAELIDTDSVQIAFGSMPDAFDVGQIVDV